jgi:hypothetical protein
VEWISLVQDEDNWMAVVKTVMDIRVLKIRGIY